VLDSIMGLCSAKPLQSETERERCKFEGVSAPIWTKAKSRL